MNNPLGTARLLEIHWSEIEYNKKADTSNLKTYGLSNSNSVFRIPTSLIQTTSFFKVGFP